MHQLRGGHMRLGSKPILRATLLYISQKKPYYETVAATNLNNSKRWALAIAMNVLRYFFLGARKTGAACILHTVGRSRRDESLLIAQKYTVG